MVKMKRMAMKVIAESLREEEIRGLREMFQVMDTVRSGTIMCLCLPPLLTTVLC
ncbi:unnamed protein product, partial [Closterium sp. NIES-54]